MKPGCLVWRRGKEWLSIPRRADRLSRTAQPAITTRKSLG